jgi:deoxyribodipyrimidine photo-lyase
MERLAAIEPVAYGKTRNYLSGAVTRLSPYLTHGAISTKDVGEVALQKVSVKEAEIVFRELAWRDFYQASWSSLGDEIFSDLRFPQPSVEGKLVPGAVVNASTGIQAIDNAINELYQTGYLHNHARMWVAMLCCSIARTAWREPSRWLYYHLLDGDIASNTLSWQWVAGSSRKEPYLANQETINMFSGSTQRNTYLDVPYEELCNEIPMELRERIAVMLTTDLPSTEIPKLSGEVLLYHAWSLNPRWHPESNLPRVLLLEPDHFARFPISKKRLSFIMDLAANIPGLVTVVATMSELTKVNPEAKFRFVAHPAVAHWSGLSEDREALFNTSKAVERSWSFSKFWSQARCSLTSQ